MKYNSILEQAWNITNNERKFLFSYALILSLVNTLLGLLYFLFQFFGVGSSPLIRHIFPDFTVMKYLSPLWQYLTTHTTLTAFMVVGMFILVCAYILLPPLFSGTFITLIARIHNNKPPVRGIYHGIRSFLPMFQYFTFTSPLSILSFFSAILLVIRSMETGLWIVFIPIICLVYAVAMILSVLFLFTEQYISLHDMSVYNGLFASGKLVLRNIEDIVFLGYSLILIALRIVINVLLIFCIPLITIGIITGLMIYVNENIAYAIGMTVASFLIGSTSYLLAGFTIYSYSVWTLSFLLFTNEQETPINS